MDDVEDVDDVYHALNKECYKKKGPGSGPKALGPGPGPGPSVHAVVTPNFKSKPQL